MGGERGEGEPVTGFVIFEFFPLVTNQPINCTRNEDSLNSKCLLFIFIMWLATNDTTT